MNYRLFLILGFFIMILSRIHIGNELKMYIFFALGLVLVAGSIFKMINKEK